MYYLGIINKKPNYNDQANHEGEDKKKVSKIKHHSRRVRKKKDLNSRMHRSHEKKN